ncbi:hypothetical protein, partial [Sphingobacterium phlebotomi]|uniref:hypothetical protein n=1 Tax=Sphingobacterium phlebotomi TaxID=2605433 RepID=UPI001CA321A4
PFLSGYLTKPLLNITLNHFNAKVDTQNVPIWSGYPYKPDRRELARRSSQATNECGDLLPDLV